MCKRYGRNVIKAKVNIEGNDYLSMPDGCSSQDGVVRRLLLVSCRFSLGQIFFDDAGIQPSMKCLGRVQVVLRAIGINAEQSCRCCCCCVRQKCLPCSMSRSLTAAPSCARALVLDRWARC